MCVWCTCSTDVCYHVCVDMYPESCFHAGSLHQLLLSSCHILPLSLQLPTQRLVSFLLLSHTRSRQGHSVWLPLAGNCHRRWDGPSPHELSYKHYPHHTSNCTSNCTSPTSNSPSPSLLHMHRELPFSLPTPLSHLSQQALCIVKLHSHLSNLGLNLTLKGQKAITLQEETYVQVKGGHSNRCVCVCVHVCTNRTMLRPPPTHRALKCVGEMSDILFELNFRCLLLSESSL